MYDTYNVNAFEEDRLLIWLFVFAITGLPSLKKLSSFFSRVFSLNLFFYFLEIFMSATQHIPDSAQFSESAEHRNMLFTSSLLRLQHLAFRAFNVLSKRNDEIVAVCIEVDSCWRPLVDTLMPNADWDTIRASGAEPVARGTAGWGVCQIVADAFPDLAVTALEKPDKGVMKAIVLNNGGCTIYDLNPKEMV